MAATNKDSPKHNTDPKAFEEMWIQVLSQHNIAELQKLLDNLLMKSIEKPQDQLQKLTIKLTILNLKDRIATKSGVKLDDNLNIILPPQVHELTTKINTLEEQRQQDLDKLIVPLLDLSVLDQTVTEFCEQIKETHKKTIGPFTVWVSFAHDKLSHISNCSKWLATVSFFLDETTRTEIMEKVDTFEKMIRIHSLDDEIRIAKQDLTHEMSSVILLPVSHAIILARLKKELVSE